MESLPLILENPRIITEYANLFQQAVDKIRDYQHRRREREIKRAVEELRDIIGRIDAAYSELLAYLQTMEERGKTQDYEKYLPKAIEISHLTQGFYGPMSEIIRLDYFSRYPELRDKLFIKTASEHVDEDDPVHDVFHNLWENYGAFKHFIFYMHYYTRDALNALNDHLDSLSNQ